MARPDTYAQVHPATRAQWRQWLVENHATSPGVWFVYFKKETGRPRVSYAEAVEEALCLGWIDSLPRRLDDERTALLFTPRKPKSGWSKVNKERIIQLEQANLLLPAGRAAIERARQNGAWESLNAAEAGLVPADLASALAAEPAAERHFNAFSPSARKMVLTWVLAARRPETRARRVAEAVRMAALNKRANFDKE